MNDEVELLRQLAATPELLAEVGVISGPELAAQSRLRERYPGELVRAAFELIELRRRAAVKFTLAERMWLDRTGLEQATPEAVARHKASRFPPDAGTVWDLCCGIGADALALAARGLLVQAVDQSAAACLRTEWNARAYGVEARIRTQLCDVRTVDVRDAWVHADPDRRGGQRRALKLEDYEPGLDWMQTLTRTARGGAIKLSPASNFGGKFAGCEIELVSLDGECKEATVWFGAAAGECEARATVLPSGESLAGNPQDFRPRASQLRRYVLDPDPAVVRAGLVDALCEHLNIFRLDAAEEYLTSDLPPASPLATAFEVLADLPNNERQIRNFFREHPCGEVEIKCRHVPVQVESLRKHIPREGTGRRTLLIARLQGKTRAIVARRSKDA